MLLYLHVGLQMVSWLLMGEVYHCDSLGGDVMVWFGEFGLMIVGVAIVHAEYFFVLYLVLLYGVQLWVVLFEESRAVVLAWIYYLLLFVVTDRGLLVIVIMGFFGGAALLGCLYSLFVGVDVVLEFGVDALFLLEVEFEHVVFVMFGLVYVDGVVLMFGSMFYLGCVCCDLRFAIGEGVWAMFFGGMPFEE